MFSQSAHYGWTPELRVRPVPEMAMCFVFTPAKPKLYTLNTSAWLVLTLCDGRRGRALVDEYQRAFGTRLTRAQALAEVRAVVPDLVDKGLVASDKQKGQQQRTGGKS